ncbi:UDP-GalNAc:beta-1,3-N-acetylgalactosaminyltransferase 2-like [Uloborus diversus]|uniref:UDP-GalNAc:beta-1, 3-N-acetylgalactosaminyltransferase 2-like n=1 Tax=Uloborus diversus TaxID=327109 RepID=UPI0024093FDF|nr:UDP-GalNAc:beta-1,3-N-acetylgalactosaminyltransferase 2-like [Uloborus diversus]
MMVPFLFQLNEVLEMVEIVYKMNYIRKEEQITNEWISYTKNLSININLEAAEYADILLVDVVDIYRNLPSKLLKFYNWLSSNHEYSYVLKTDDDIVIDINRLLQKLKDDVLFNSSSNWLLSRFRKEWPVNYIGKWADYDYRSPIYPSFPCGAAYILSRNVVSWLHDNSDQLFPYQGEDVSMGIWLAAIKPEYIDDENFECDSRCHYLSYNRAQLTPEQIYDVWSAYEKCNNLCSCK